MIIIVNFDKSNIANPLVFHQYITTLYGVTDWWHYLDSTYILYGLTLTTRSVRDSIRSGYPNVHCLISEFDYRNFTGNLHPDAWDWLGKYAVPKRIKILRPKGITLKLPQIRLGTRLPVKGIF